MCTMCATLLSIVRTSPESSVNVSSSRSSSLAFVGRFSGSFDRHRMTMSDSDCGTCGCTSINGFGS